MTTDEQLKEILTGKQKGFEKLPAILRWVTATAVNQKEQTMDAIGVTDGLEFFDIQLGSGSMVIYPAVGATCLVAIVEGQATDAFIISASEIERIEVTASASIVMNGGSNGGLINIEALTEKINGLVDKFNQHTHLVSGVQPGSGLVTAPAPALKAASFDKKDYEDSKITH